MKAFNTKSIVEARGLSEDLSESMRKYQLKPCDDAVLKFSLRPIFKNSVQKYLPGDQGVAGDEDRFKTYSKLHIILSKEFRVNHGTPVVCLEAMCKHIFENAPVTYVCERVIDEITDHFVDVFRASIGRFNGVPMTRENACSVASAHPPALSYVIIDVDAIVAKPLFRGKDDAYVSLVDSDEEPENVPEQEQTPLTGQNACSTTVVAVKSSKGKDRAMPVEEQEAPCLPDCLRAVIVARLKNEGVDPTLCTGGLSDEVEINAAIDRRIYQLRDQKSYLKKIYECIDESFQTDELSRWGKKGQPLTYSVGDKSSSYQPPENLTLTAEKKREALGFFDYHDIDLVAMRYHRSEGDSDSDNEDGEDLQTDIVIYNYCKKFPFIRSLFEPTETGEGSAGGGTGKRPRQEEATDMAGASSSGKQGGMQLSHIKGFQWNLFDILQEGNKYDDKSHKDLLILVLREAFGTPKSRSGRMRSPTSDRVFEWIMDTLRFIQGRLQDKFYKISGVLIQQFEISYLSKEQIEALATFLKDNCVHSLSEYKDYDGVMDSDDDDKAGAPSSAKKANETVYINEDFERELFPILKNEGEVDDGVRKCKLLTLLRREFSTPVSTSGHIRKIPTYREFEWIMGSLKDIQKTSCYKFYRVRKFLAQHFRVYCLSEKQIEELANFLENNCVHSHAEDKDPLKF